MGNEQSAAEQNDWGRHLPRQLTIGFHVLRVLANSPAANAGLEPWFDYICGVNSIKLVHLAGKKANVGQDKPTPPELHSTICSTTETSRDIHSLLCQRSVTTRYPSLGNEANEDVYIEPTEEVGLSLRWCPLSSSANVWHVLEVHPTSPAEIAGFVPFNDYIIGSPERILRGEADLGELVEQVIPSQIGG